MQEAKAAERLGSRRTGAETRPDGGGAGGPARGQSQASAGAGPEGETEVGSDGGARGVSKHSWQYRVARQTTLPRPCAASIHLGSGGNLEARVAKQSAPSHAAGPGQGVCSPAVPKRRRRFLPLPLALGQLRTCANWENSLKEKVRQSSKAIA